MKGARLSQILCLKRAYLSQILICFLGFHHQKTRNCDICLTRDKSAYYQMSNVPPQSAVCPQYAGRTCKINGPGWITKSFFFFFYKHCWVENT